MRLEYFSRRSRSCEGVSSQLIEFQAVICTSRVVGEQYIKGAPTQISESVSTSRLDIEW